MENDILDKHLIDIEKSLSELQSAQKQVGSILNNSSDLVTIMEELLATFQSVSKAVTIDSESINEKILGTTRVIQEASTLISSSHKEYIKKLEVLSASIENHSELNFQKTLALQEEALNILRDDHVKNLEKLHSDVTLKIQDFESIVDKLSASINQDFLDFVSRSVNISLEQGLKKLNQLQDSNNKKLQESFENFESLNSDLNKLYVENNKFQITLIDQLKALQKESDLKHYVTWIVITVMSILSTYFIISS